MSARGVVLAVVWLATRVWLVWLLGGSQEWVNGDVVYFRQSLDALGGVGLDHTLVEYPVPAVAVLGLPWLGARWLTDGDGYGQLMNAAALLADLGFTMLLARASRSWGVLVWLLGVPLLGATALARFDVYPGVLCGLALLLLASRPGLAAASVALAAGIKLWPVLAIPPLYAMATSRRVFLAVVALTGLLLVAGTVVVSSWSRLTSPLTYQFDRGLQIESVLATPAIVAWLKDPQRWVIGYAPSNSFEVSGPGIDGLLALGTVLTAAYLLALGIAWRRLWLMRDHLSTEAVVWLVLAAVTGFVAVGKVFSPQYVLWLLPVAAAGLVVADSVRLRAWSAGLLVTAGLTQLVFPTWYGGLTLRQDPVWLVVGVLALRNGLTVLLLGAAVWSAWRGLYGEEASARTEGSSAGKGAGAPPARPG